MVLTDCNGLSRVLWGILGGRAGILEAPVTPKSCFWDLQTTNQHYSSKIEPQAHEEKKFKEFYQGKCTCGSLVSSLLEKGMRCMFRCR